MAVKQISINDLRLDGGTQQRVRLNDDHVQDLNWTLLAKKPLPPPIVFHDGTDFWVADGHHTVRAIQGAFPGINKKVDCEVKKGSQRDAVLYSCGANAEHGLKRSNADKGKAVGTLLADPEWSQWSDRKIAETAGVSHPFVAQVRAAKAGDEDGYATANGAVAMDEPPAPGEVGEGGPEGRGEPPPARRVGKDGKAYPMPKRKKSGKVGFDDRVILDLMGRLVRAVHERAKEHGKGTNHDTMRAGLRTAAEAFKAWQKEKK